MIVHIVDKKIFQEVLRAGATTKTEHFTLYRLNALSDKSKIAEADNLQIGLIVPKRQARKAVTRNAIKRQAYSISRELASEYANELHVIRLSKEFERKDYHSASSKLLKTEIDKEIRALYNLVD